ncbi:MAG: hypothetical protein NT061_00160 [Spirochaetes bacterium]|nr:hypothetical protein [Spirochaetota bacterium]
MKAFIKRYSGFIVAAIILAAFILILPGYREKSLLLIIFQTKTMLLVIPPIFILLGLFDVWVPREKMMRFMGPSSGVSGNHHHNKCNNALPSTEGD